jgi:hypothetical protein
VNLSRRAFLVAAAAAASSCFTTSVGKAPDPLQIYFPTGVLMSAGRTALYVVNSDFDLQYAGGTLQAYDARALRARIRPIAEQLGASDPAKRATAAVACAAAGLSTNPDTFLNPGPCSPIDATGYVARSAFLGAFGSSPALAYKPCDAGDASCSGARLFTPVRGDPSITYFDVDDDRLASVAAAPTFRLDCNAGEDGFCGDDHRVGRNPDRTLRGLQLPPDPIGTAVSDGPCSDIGCAVVSAHQTQAAVSLIVNPWNGIPSLSYFVSRLAPGPTELATLPRPAVATLAKAAGDTAMPPYPVSYRDAFLLTYRGASQLDLVEYEPDSGSSPPRPFVVIGQQIALTVNASNVDSRGIAVVGDARAQCEATCPAEMTPAARLECAGACAEKHPLDVYVATRTPATLMFGTIRTHLSREPVPGSTTGALRITGLFNTIDVHQSIPLDFGASHVRVGKVVGKDGKLVTRLFALAFDAREVFIVDPETRTVEVVIKAGRGPQDVAIDSGIENGQPYSFMYVAHFTDSYLGAVDLDLRRPLTYGQIFATVGNPTPPAESR